MCICLLEQFTASSVNLHSKNSAPGHVVFSYDCPTSRSSYIQKVLCSEGPMFRKYLFRKSYVQMVFYSEGPMFGRSYIQKVVYSEDLCSSGRSYVGTHFHLSFSCIKTFFLSQFISRFFFISFIILLFTFSWDTRY